MNLYREAQKNPYIVKVFSCPYNADFKYEKSKWIKRHWSEYFQEQLDKCYDEGLTLVSHSLLDTNTKNPYLPNDQGRYQGVMITCVFLKFKL